MFGVVVTKATMSTSCDILAFAGDAGEMGWWGGGRRVFSSVSPASVFCMSWRAAINVGCFRSCLYSSPVNTIVVCNKCSKDQLSGTLLVNILFIGLPVLSQV